MQAIVLLLVLPFILLNMLGGLCGGIWLAILGEWRLVFFGILYMMGGSFLISFLLLPGMAFAAPAAMAAERRRFVLTAILGVPAIGWTFAAMTVSCVLISAAIGRHIEGSPIPYLLWAYAAATAPWSYMASAEARSGNDSASGPLLFCQLGTISVMVALLRNHYDTDFWRLVWWFGPFAVLGFVIQFSMVVMAGFASKRAY